MAKHLTSRSCRRPHWLPNKPARKRKTKTEAHKQWNGTKWVHINDKPVLTRAPHMHLPGPPYICGLCTDEDRGEFEYCDEGEPSEDEKMGKGEIHSRPPGDSIRKVHRPGTMKWDGKQWVLAQHKPSIS